MPDTELRKKKPSCTEPLSKIKKGEMRYSLPDRRCRIRQQVPPTNYPHSCRKVSFSAVRQASLTVEAVWAVPLFFLAVLSLICMTELYGIYAEKAVRLQERVETTAAYASLAGGYAPPAIELWDRFTYRPQWYPEALPGAAVTVRGRVRPWTGRTAEEAAEAASGPADELVYVTDYESVYHTSSECTHLALSVNAIGGNKVGSARNVYGDRYHACEKCVGSGGKNTVVYVTKEGDHYHNSASCSGLNRTTRLVRKSEVESLPLCSRCQAAGHGGGSHTAGYDGDSYTAPQAADGQAAAQAADSQAAMQAADSLAAGL